MKASESKQRCNRKARHTQDTNISGVLNDEQWEMTLILQILRTDAVIMIDLFGLSWYEPVNDIEPDKYPGDLTLTLRMGILSMKDRNYIREHIEELGN